MENNSILLLKSKFFLFRRGKGEFHSQIQWEFLHTTIGKIFTIKNGYGVELMRLYNPASIRMLVFINTDKEKDAMKCIERICSYVAFDNSLVEELKLKE
ncbi:MAG: hypothetical protein IJ013_00930 [Bacteroidaceae bacterium]|nr:hypothetical protein [Bacteroidaceae bacterium]